MRMSLSVPPARWRVISRLGLGESERRSSGQARPQLPIRVGLGSNLRSGSQLSRSQSLTAASAAHVASRRTVTIATFFSSANLQPDRYERSALTVELTGPLAGRRNAHACRAPG